MVYKEFCKMMEQKLPEYLPKDLPALIRPGAEGGEDYLEVRAPGSDFSTKIWLAALYTMFQCGISENVILMRSADQAALVLRSKEDWILDWQQAKTRILPAAVPYSAEALKETPFHRIENIAIVIRAEVMNGNAVLTVTDSLMKHWKVTMEELLHEAVVNGMARYPLEVQHISSAISQLAASAGVEAESGLQEDDRVFVARSDSHFGAGVIAYRDFFSKCREAVKGSFWLLPSSIHEWMVVKDDGRIDGKALECILKGCNMTTIAPEEFLGDRVLHYSVTGEVLETAEDWMKRTESEGNSAELRIHRAAC